MRIERIGDATLYHGDCRTVLPKLLGAHTVVTDPVWPTAPPGACDGADGNQGALLREALLLIASRTVVIVMGFDCDPRFLINVPARWPYIRSQQLPYAMPGYRGRLLGGDEMAYVFGEIPHGRGVIPGRVQTETSTKAERANGHPFPRTETHMRALVGWWSLPGERVLDPFMGSGTTGVAAVQAGRQFIGMETDRRYFDIACERIDNAYRQARMFA